MNSQINDGPKLDNEGSKMTSAKDRRPVRPEVAKALVDVLRAKDRLA